MSILHNLHNYVDASRLGVHSCNVRCFNALIVRSTSSFEGG